MRCLGYLIIVSVLALSVANAKPRVASLNLCADQLVMMLSDKTDIASLSPLARDPAISLQAAAAQSLPLNDGTAETILAEKPDLVIAGTYTTQGATALLRRIGFRVENLPIIDDPNDIALWVRQVGEWLEQPERAENMATAFAAKLENIRQMRWLTQPRAAFYLPGGDSEGAGSLSDAVLYLAGFINLAAEQKLIGMHGLALEKIITAAPDAVLLRFYRPQQPTMNEDFLHHPALQQLPAKRLDLPPGSLTCGDPGVIAAIDALIAAHQTFERGGL